MDKEHLLDVAIQQLVVDNGASLNDIARAAGTSRATLHRYFASRLDLLRAIALKAATDAEQAIQQSRIDDDSSLEALTRVVHLLMPIGHRCYFLLRLNEPELEHDSDVSTTINRLSTELDRLILRGQQEGVLRADFSVRWTRKVIGELLFATWEGMRDGYIAPLEATQIMLNTLLNGIGISTEQTGT
ncbi:MAG: TetR/AcrR family transcriptional regulator [Chloroflexota bacterium]